MRLEKVWLVETVPLKCGGKLDGFCEDADPTALLLFATGFDFLPFTLLLDDVRMPKADNAVTGAFNHVSISDGLKLAT